MLGWTAYEVVVTDSSGQPIKRPFSDTLAAKGAQLALHAIKAMRMVLAHGWPDASKDYIYEGRRRVVRKDSGIWLLKCMPHCWRLYFYVRTESKQIVYVHAVCKKKDDENEQDAIRAGRIADKIADGERRAIRKFQFPA